jgi:hypothetical protein
LQAVLKLLNCIGGHLALSPDTKLGRTICHGRTLLLCILPNISDKEKNTTFTSADIPIKLFWSKFVHSFKGYNVFVAVQNIYDYETV